MHGSYTLRDMVVVAMTVMMTWTQMDQIHLRQHHLPPPLAPSLDIHCKPIYFTSILNILLSESGLYIRQVRS